MEYTQQEFMAIVTGREIKDGQLIILGVGLSMLAGYFAQKNHAFIPAHFLGDRLNNSFPIC